MDWRREQEFWRELDRIARRSKPKFPWRSVILNGIGAVVTLIIILLVLWYS